MKFGVSHAVGTFVRRWNADEHSRMYQDRPRFPYEPLTSFGEGPNPVKDSSPPFGQNGPSLPGRATTKGGDAPSREYVFMGGMVRWPMVSCLARETNDGASFYPSRALRKIRIFCHKHTKLSSLHQGKRSKSFRRTNSTIKVPASCKPLILFSLPCPWHGKEFATKSSRKNSN